MADAKASPPRKLILQATPERMRKAGPHVERFNADIDGAEHHDTIRVYDDSPIDILYPKSITFAQWCAGRRLYADWFDGGLASSGVVDLDKPFVDNGARREPVDRQLDALNRYRSALEGVGIVHAHPLEHLAIAGITLAAYGRMRFGVTSRNIAAASARATFRAALDALVLHYEEADGRPRNRSRMRAVALAADYRPKITP